SENAVQKILAEYFDVENAAILRTENGKPYLEKGKDIPLFFSVSHTKDALFIAFCDENVGIDAERLDKQVDYLPIIKRFSDTEREEINSKQAFLRNFTAKESAVKWLGGSLARDFRKLQFVDGKIVYGEIRLPVYTAFPAFDGFVVAVTSERDFSRAETILL
ncbi:MAG: 4'-phosphopantetheinyl transferase superfamily protein, partial [Clostridia bacterium]|nr:4'-phosphopantetheinyl transferase superfamily protein [Clostridia bacterium]